MSTLPDIAYVLLTEGHLWPYQQEVEDASEWIRNELGARSPSQTTRVLEAANYLVMPLFIVAFGVTIQVPGTGETALQIGTLRPPTPNLAPGHQFVIFLIAPYGHALFNSRTDLATSRCAICHESDEGAATRLDCAHCFHTICIFSWLYRDSTCPLCRYDVTFQSIVKLAGDEWVIPKAYVAGVLSQWLMPSY